MQAQETQHTSLEDMNVQKEEEEETEEGVRRDVEGDKRR